MKETGLQPAVWVLPSLPAASSPVVLLSLTVPRHFPCAHHRALKARPKSAKELELAEMLAFEGYRDLIRLSCLGLTEAQGIAHAQARGGAGRGGAAGRLLRLRAGLPARCYALHVVLCWLAWSSVEYEYH